ncbi:MAG TPA: RuBisCO large subunit C-terminal-like domain-containing protein [Thermoanaerobaculia bacterium]|nr:RuBisCO large subunit C-terminal-like domain-containing protein [Thermoanaerobaculia bacterium]
MDRTDSGPEPLGVIVDLALAAGESAEERAASIAREQTVELDLALVPETVRLAAAGRVEEVVPLGPRRARATLAFPLAAVGGELPQLLNLLFGNVSMQRGVRIAEVRWPAALLASFRGPAFGLDGLRALCGATARRPLVMAALKPLGLSAAGLAALAGRLARGGIDLVKDDHSLCDQPWAPFAERVARCQEAVERANRGGRSCLYVPNLTGPADRLGERVERLRRLGVRAALVAPLLVGLDTVRALAATSGLALLAHPSLSGGLLGRGHGLAPRVLWGDLFRIAGADGVVYPNAGGRFRFSLAECLDVAAALRRPLGGLAPAFPVLGGGVDVARIRAWRRRYGPDTVFLVGGSLLGQTDLERGAAALRSEAER